MTTSILEYGPYGFYNDLKKFNRKRNKPIFYHKGHELTAICKTHGINPMFFIACTYAESLMLVAVHAHNYSFYNKYKSHLGHDTLLGQVAALGGLKLPQKMFHGVIWKEEDFLALKTLFKQFIPTWCTHYDKLVERNHAGKRLIESLIYDPDLAHCPKGVQPELMKAIEEGFMDASKSLGIVYDPDRPRRRHSA